MVNISFAGKVHSVAPIKIAALGEAALIWLLQVDAHLVQFRKELDSHNQSGLNFHGYL